LVEKTSSKEKNVEEKFEEELKISEKTSSKRTSCTELTDFKLPNSTSKMLPPFNFILVLVFCIKHTGSVLLVSTIQTFLKQTRGTRRDGEVS
jgi:hypothetical protein